ncbi:MAG: HK97-gp10 family putative phage morphogenesis protein [Bacilli bacterium]|jgi:HK97 gp10 family phage protein
MAKATVKMPEEFLKKLSRLGNKTDEITAKVLQSGGEVVFDKVKINLESVVGSDTKVESRSTGELVNSLGVSSVRQDRNGNSNIKIGFSEPRKDGKSNAMIANIIEYGKHNQPARPFLKPAIRTTKQACMDTMIGKLEEEINKI